LPLCGKKKGGGSLRQSRKKKNKIANLAGRLGAPTIFGFWGREKIKPQKSKKGLPQSRQEKKGAKNFVALPQTKKGKKEHAKGARDFYCFAIEQKL